MNSRIAMTLTLIAVLAACGGATINYSPITSVGRSPTSVAKMEVYFDEVNPSRPYVATGMFEGRSHTELGVRGKLMQEFKVRAAAEGLDGIFGFTCGKPGTWGSDECVAKGFIYK